MILALFIILGLLAFFVGVAGVGYCIDEMFDSDSRWDFVWIAGGVTWFLGAAFGMFFLIFIGIYAQGLA